ncbi:uncharacterized protein A1O9_02915 [Exophiala aquamarina CBS 119918]|uniref:histidine kinase n=1 Tax=Exophiala aquamarina CBS 119918 TaxID=1182545 RepID=A0A072PMQ5_9EURO|nr:uncharacterized protein A1O9_02915 [Exophiala aquamarina CBS 119918]KEF61349.1 hypothetical protein A1O9_02915 [Exophiala aquamarina CBS 119918]
MDLYGVSFLDAMTYSLHFREESGLGKGQNRNDEIKSRSRETMSIQLGHSVGFREHKHGSGKQSQAPARLCPLPAFVQQTLIWEYPHGHIFNFDDHGLIPSSPPSLHVGVDSRLVVPETHVYLQSDDRNEVWAALQQYLPGATSVIFMPLWDSHRQFWFSGMFAWTTDPQRVLLPEDKAYYLEFGKSVMAEAARADLVATNRAKSDFISLISHELRSPLHGILASSELLLDKDPSGEQLQMIHIIENCGRTLLDTMEHILDYSKINSLKSRLPSTDRKSSIPATAPLIGESSSLTSFDLSIMVEETLESSTFSHGHNTRSVHDPTRTEFSSITPNDLSMQSSSATTAIVLSIENKSSWRIQSEIGIWRRILLNVLGNALKYTSKGLINVTLGLEKDLHLTQDETLRTVRLTITDTGRGISQDYLRNRLYTPFVQEDSLSTGVGLGLNIVRQLVEDLNGSITIDSTVNVGTQVTVKFPVKFLEDAVQKADQELGEQPMYLLRLGVSDEKATGLESNLSLGECQNALTRSFTDLAEQWLRANVELVENLSSISKGIVAVHEYDIPWLVRELSNNNPAFKIRDHSCFLVLCATKPAGLVLDLQFRAKFQTLNQPFGPRNLANAVKACLQLIASERTTGATDKQGSNTSINGPDKGSQACEVGLCSPPPSTTTTRKIESDIFVAPKPRRNLLLVDDNAINLRLLVAFAKLDCTFTMAQNGREALKAYQCFDKRFDYVLMEVSMPVMDSFSAAMAIRAHERNQDLQRTIIMALTGLGSEKAQQKAASCGFDLLLAKPVSLQKLKNLIAP